MKAFVILIIVCCLAFLANADKGNLDDSDLEKAGTIWIGRPGHSGGYGGYRSHRPKYGYGGGGGGYGYKQPRWHRPCYGFGCGYGPPRRPNQKYNDWGHRILGKPGGDWIPGR